MAGATPNDRRFSIPWQRSLVAGLVWSISAGVTTAATPPTVEQAIGLAPVQRDVEYDRPSSGEVKDCTMQVEKQSGHTAWVVRDGNGRTLRIFADTNGDNVVDRWSYFHDGLEVYRDIDSNFNSKADQCRWFHTAGSRWGIDRNEDGRIDSWKAISAEEATAELVAALQTRDVARFERLLLSGDELKNLGLGAEHAEQLGKALKKAPSRFRNFAKGQKDLRKTSKFVDFGGSQPGVVPAGTRGSKKDILVYENIAALVETGGKHHQIQVGTLIHVDGAWRLIGVPETGFESDSTGGTRFFQASHSPRSETPPPVEGGPSKEVRAIMAQLEKLDAQAASATPSQQEKIYVQQADLLARLAADAEETEQHDQWVRQMADMVSAAVQTGSFSNGVKRLHELEARLLKKTATKELGAYVRFRRMTAEYGQSLQAKNADFAKVQEQWLKDLQEFVKDFPRSTDSAEALLQLAIAEEFAGRNDEAQKWYAQIVRGFPTSEAGRKAAGAQRRLRSPGKTMELRGEGLTGKPVDLGKYRGKVVLVQY